MLFDVVKLRCGGRRLLRAYVLQAVPMRGDLSTTDTGARHGLVATLTAAGAELARLERATITRVASSSLVLAGVELVDGMRQEQEWWCRQVSGGPPRPYNADPPSAVVRDRSYSPA